MPENRYKCSSQVHRAQSDVFKCPVGVGDYKYDGPDVNFHDFSYLSVNPFEINSINIL